MNIYRRRFFKIASLTGAVSLVGIYSLFIERYIILTTHYKISVSHLPPSFSGFRIVQLTDLHYGFLMPLSIIQKVIERVNQIPRDLVVCTGDYVHKNNTPTQVDTVWPVLSQLTAPEGVFSVLGNHDHWADTERSLYWLAQSGQDISHKVKAIERNGEKLWLAGAGDLWEDHHNLDDLLKGIPADDCRIVLAHNPDSANTDYASRIDLMLSGHTHGGQVHIPFLGSPVLPVKNKNYDFGLKKSLRGTPVFISRGIGWAVYPIRFNCYPEISVLELVPFPEKI